MRHFSVQLDDGTIAFLADQRDKGEGYDMAAVDAHERGSIESRFRLRDRPWTHALTATVVNECIVCICLDAADLSDLDETGSVGALDRYPSHCGDTGRSTVKAVP